MKASRLITYRFNIDGLRELTQDVEGEGLHEWREVSYPRQYGIPMRVVELWIDGGLVLREDIDDFHAQDAMDHPSVKQALESCWADMAEQARLDEARTTYRWS